MKQLLTLVLFIWIYMIYAVLYIVWVERWWDFARTTRNCACFSSLIEISTCRLLKMTTKTKNNSSFEYFFQKMTLNIKWIERILTKKQEQNEEEHCESMLKKEHEIPMVLPDVFKKTSIRKLTKTDISSLRPLCRFTKSPNFIVNLKQSELL